MMKVLLFLLTTAVFAQGRLDPHGRLDVELKQMKLEKHTECLTCHHKQNNNWEPKKEIDQSCLACHNPRSHSGLEEHMGKVQKKGMPNPGKKIGCFDCHRAHRATSREKSLEWKSKPSFIFYNDKELSNHFKVKHAQTPMLKHSCTDCHSWKSLR